MNPDAESFFLRVDTFLGKCYPQLSFGLDGLKLGLWDLLEEFIEFGIVTLQKVRTEETLGNL